MNRKTALTSEQTDKIIKSVKFNTSKVNVSYPDGKGAHQTTVGELKQRFKQETKQWRERFFNELHATGKTHSNFGTYELV